MLLLRATAPVLETHAYVLAAEEGGTAVVVDPGAGAAPVVTELLFRHRLRLGAVVITHGHADHVWDAAALAGDAPVYIAPRDAYRLEDPAGALGPLGEYFTQLAPTPWQSPAGAAPFPASWLTGGGGEAVPGVVLRAVPAPGHTEGSTLLLARGRVETDGVLPAHAEPDDDGMHLVALCGDVFFAGSIGRTDLPGGDADEMSATLRTLTRALPPHTVLLPGHGPATVLADELATNPYVREALGRR
ncbi:MBL fold metallo-hydrolase [Georgenia ruanii]|uniref:MBL fold metallo-hydrolase n=1 Tax=Georgenia ruanii TaxID=348442 RepID=A0A7J9UVX5_9MICO|nr:MBL fold metallo-hydrolase [Georgenia ruanii]MPV88757.1 MBL fold metallo-hydrolase [Georgenia ruanii]